MENTRSCREENKIAVRNLGGAHACRGATPLWRWAPGQVDPVRARVP